MKLSEKEINYLRRHAEVIEQVTSCQTKEEAKEIRDQTFDELESIVASERLDLKIMVWATRYADGKGHNKESTPEEQVFVEFLTERPEVRKIASLSRRLGVLLNGMKKA